MFREVKCSGNRCLVWYQSYYLDALFLKFCFSFFGALSLICCMEVKTRSLAWSSFREATLQLSPHRNHTSANLLPQLHASKLQTSARAVFYVCLDQRRMLHRDIDSRPAKRPRSWWCEGIKAVCRPRHTVTSYMWLHSQKSSVVMSSISISFQALLGQMSKLLSGCK